MEWITAEGHNFMHLIGDDQYLPAAIIRWAETGASYSYTWVILQPFKIPESYFYGSIEELKEKIEGIICLYKLTT